MPETGIQTKQSPPPPLAHRNRWLTLIAITKLLQAVFFLLLGFGVLHFLHKDVEDEVARLILHLRFNPESKLINFILVKASVVDDRMIRRISSLVFVYAALDVIEGIGLYLEKFWAECMTVLITGAFLPWEVIEVIHKVTWIRVTLLTINTLVFLYLLKIITDLYRRKQNAQNIESTSDSIDA